MNSRAASTPLQYRQKRYSKRPRTRTAATGMAKAGVPPHVLAAILNHTPGSTMGVTSIYNRFRYTGERHAALEAWAVYVLSLETNTGTTDAAIQTDLQTMLAALGSWSDVVWIAPIKTAAFLAFKFGNPSLNYANVMGFTIIGSASSPASLALIDLGDVLLAEGQTEVSIAESAALVMTSSPQSSPMTSALINLDVPTRPGCGSRYPAHIMAPPS
jgi:hypothetical protein